jgi:hypothetical protein
MAERFIERMAGQEGTKDREETGGIARHLRSKRKIMAARTG